MADISPKQAMTDLRYISDLIREEYEYSSMRMDKCLDAIDQHIAASQRAEVVVSEDAKDAKDAERYRWLRKHHTRKWFTTIGHQPSTADFSFECEGHDIDAAIDAALTAALAARGE